MLGDELTGVVLDDRYRIIEPVAQGAMGTVYRAERVKLGRIVAIKVLHEELPNELSARQRFEIEALTMAKLDHPNCASVLDVGMHQDRPYVVMDFVSGTDLKQVVSDGPVEPARAIAIVMQVLSGLAHAHQLGIVHRDVKPANIMLDQKIGLGDHVKVCDFGLARSTTAPVKLTHGFSLGTPAYMAPEQILGGDVDSRTDLYSCGVLLFELLTGTLPFRSERDDPIEVVQMHLRDVPPRLDSMTPTTTFGALEDIVAKALAKAPADRYADAAAFAAALATASTAPVPAEPSTAATAPAPAGPSPSDRPSALDPALAPPRSSGDTFDGLPFSRRQLAIGAGGLVGVVVIVAIIATLAGGGGEPRASDVDGPDAALATVPEIEMEPMRASDGPDRILERANQLVTSGQADSAITLLVRESRRFPADARLPYLAGRLYFAKLWWTDGLKHLRRAVATDPALADDPVLIKLVLKAFLTTSEPNRSLADFLYETIGPAAVPYLEETVRDHPSPSVRARAKAELTRY